MNAIRGVLEGYKSAYDTKDLAKLQELWPDMSPKQVSGLRTAFHDAGKVTLTYAITKGPEVAGNVAVVSFQQQIITNAAAKAQVTMTLRKDGSLLAHHFYPLVELRTHTKRRLMARVPTCGSREAISCGASGLGTDGAQEATSCVKR